MSSRISLTVHAQAEHFDIQCRLNDRIFYHGCPGTVPVVVAVDVDDDVQDQYRLSIELSGKTAADTQIQEGCIVADALVHVYDIAVDDFDISDLFYAKSIYSHDFNGSQPGVEQQFHRTMGCNGVVTFEFESPIYQWLLHNV